MGLEIVFGFSVWLLILGAAYVGWNLGRVDGYRAAQSGLVNSGHSYSNDIKTTTAIIPLSDSLHSIRTLGSSLKPVYRYADISRSFKEVKRAVERLAEIGLF